MTFIITAKKRGLFGSDVDEAYRQRNRVFADRFGWKIPELSEYYSTQRSSSRSNSA